MFDLFDIRKAQEQILFDSVKAASDEATAHAIVYENAPDSNAAWVTDTMRKLDERFAPAKRKQIRMNCQCGFAMDEKEVLVRELYNQSSSMEAFCAHEKAHAAGLSTIDGELHLQFPFCPCPMLADVAQLQSDSWCQCTTGYSKVLFEKVFGCPVEVTLLQSVKMGDAVCLMKIVPTEDIWVQKN